MIIRSHVCLVIACLGCGKKKDAPASAGSAAGSTGSGSAVAKAAAVSAKLDGKALAVETALAKQLPDGRVQLYLGQGGTCEQLMTNLFDGHSEHVLIDLKRLLLADGGETIGVGDVWAGPPSAADQQSKGEIFGELTKGAKAQIELKVTSAEAKLELEGTVTAESCGDQDVPPVATAGAATMTIAGKSFVIRAALKRGDDIELTDLPRDCTSAHYIGVRVKRERGVWHVDGTRIPVELTGPAPELKVVPGPTKESPGPGHVMMALSGEGKIAAYTVKLDGVVDMTDCSAK